MAEIPEFHHLIKIREELWSGLKYGKAAVVVGSGFSRNAIPTSITTPLLPLWEELGNRLVDTLYPLTPSNSEVREHARAHAKTTSGVLRIAEEFETEFDRSKLDDLLVRLIPDLEYQPSELHEELLDLPWSDVLTALRFPNGLHSRRSRSLFAEALFRLE